MPRGAPNQYPSTAQATKRSAAAASAATPHSMVVLPGTRTRRNGRLPAVPPAEPDSTPDLRSSSACIGSSRNATAIANVLCLQYSTFAMGKVRRALRASPAEPSTFRRE